MANPTLREFLDVLVERDDTSLDDGGYQKHSLVRMVLVPINSTFDPNDMATWLPVIEQALKDVADLIIAIEALKNAPGSPATMQALTDSAGRLGGILQVILAILQGLLGGGKKPTS
jgi:hypothetical protein